MKNANSNSKPTNYTLSQEDLKIIEDDAKYIFEFINKTFDSMEEARLKWLVRSEDFLTLCNYQEFLAQNFSVTPGAEYHVEEEEWTSTPCLSILIDYFPVCLEKIKEVSRFVFETARSRGCYYISVCLDVIADDDPRLRY